MTVETVTPPKITLLPAFTDNYLFVVEHEGNAMVVDPGDATVVQDYLKSKNLKLKIILITHNHHDHIGGVEQLKRESGAAIYAPLTTEKFGLKCDLTLSEGKKFEFGGRTWETLHLPGHTLDHLAYFNATDHILFCGDVLFSLGCGRLFEGTPQQMFQSLGKIEKLPTDTLIYCAHEYTEKNAKFSEHFVKSENAPPHIIAAYKKLALEITKRREQGLRTVPTRLDFELQYNLFLRAADVDDFTKIREARNRF